MESEGKGSKDRGKRAREGRKRVTNNPVEKACEREGKGSENDEKRTGTRREKVQRMMAKGQGHGGKRFRG
jgi:hypothetical protein